MKNAESLIPMSRSSASSVVSSPTSSEESGPAGPAFRNFFSRMSGFFGSRSGSAPPSEGMHPGVSFQGHNLAKEDSASRGNHSNCHENRVREFAMFLFYYCATALFYCLLCITPSPEDGIMSLFSTCQTGTIQPHRL